MKKKIFLACVALSMSATAIIGYRMYKISNNYSLLELNLESLTQQEAIPGGSCILEGLEGPYELVNFCAYGTVAGQEIKPCPIDSRMGRNSGLKWACHKLNQ